MSEPDRGDRVGDLRRGEGVPAEVHAPVEAAAHQRRRVVRERVGVDEVDRRNDDARPVVVDTGEQRPQPIGVRLAVAVEEHQDLPTTARSAGHREPIYLLEISKDALEWPI